MSSTAAKIPTTVTSSQVVACSHVYWIAAVCVLTPPLAMIAAPMTMKSTSFVLDFITRQHTIATVILAAALIPLISKRGEKVVMNAAPSRKEGKDSAALVKKWSPHMAVGISIMFCRWVLPLLESIFGVSAAASLPRFPFATALKLEARILEGAAWPPLDDVRSTNDSIA